MWQILSHVKSESRCKAQLSVDANKSSGVFMRRIFSSLAFIFIINCLYNVVSLFFFFLWFSNSFSHKIIDRSWRTVRYTKRYENIGKHDYTFTFIHSADDFIYTVVYTLIFIWIRMTDKWVLPLETSADELDNLLRCFIKFLRN